LVFYIPPGCTENAHAARASNQKKASSLGKAPFFCASCRVHKKSPDQDH
jgi:hypothetical protein